MVTYIVHIRGYMHKRVKFDCTGSYIDYYWVLTAAHCIEPIIQSKNEALTEVCISKTLSECGDSTLVRKVRRHIKHPSYSNYPPQYEVENDIGLLKLDNPFNLNLKTIDLGKMYKQELSNATLSEKLLTRCVIVGWGLVSSNYEAILPDQIRYTAMTQSWRCYSDKNIYLYNVVICNRGLDELRRSCMGDSGAPLICNNHIVGIVARAINGYPCGRSGATVVYTPIYPYLPWMSEVVVKNVRYD